MNNLPNIDLILLGNGSVDWKLGKTFRCHSELGGIVPTVQKAVEHGDAEALLFWDAALGQPPEAFVVNAMNRPLDLYHAGLCLGMAGLPGAINYVHPTWMFNRDPSPEIEATSWRVSLRACLVRTEVLRKMGFLRPEFSTMDAAALEWGLRLITHGVLMRHVPSLLAANFQPSTFNLQLPTKLPFSDELRFVHFRFGRKWAAWAVFRALMTRYVGIATALRAWRSVMSTSRPPEPAPYRASSLPSLSASDGERAGVRCAPSTSSTLNSQLSTFNPQPRVSVLIPTVDRYPYLRTLLDQLRRQTLLPCEIIVVDQTHAAKRDAALARDFADLPFSIILRDEPGQCSSRNAGLEAASGDCILFLDDDVEVSPDMIQAHWETLSRFQAGASSGVAQEVGCDPLPDSVRCLRASDVFPAGNTMVARSALEKSGLFDLAYEKGARADGDLGLRIYLTGELMVLNGGIQVLHHRAPSGGLRKHRARETTRTTSRTSLFSRHLPGVTEMYLYQRHFSRKQVRETTWVRMLGTFSIGGGFFRKLIKCLIGTFALPQTCWVTGRNGQAAGQMLKKFPVIPMLPRQVERHNPPKDRAGVLHFSGSPLS